ncbi:MAG: hypothetical protein AVDCRST_MAG83-1950, partial [uncultured Arthrobacter sp.]
CAASSAVASAGPGRAVPVLISRQSGRDPAAGCPGTSGPPDPRIGNHRVPGRSAPSSDPVLLIGG